MGYELDPEGAEVRALYGFVDLAGLAVLEVGCGDGRLTRRYAQRAASVLAIDPKGDEIAAAESAQARLPRCRVTFREADIVDARLPVAAFDVALFSWSL